MRANEFVLETYLNGSYAPLYHSTNLISAIKIAKANELRVAGHESRTTNDVMNYSTHHKFVSLTRSLNFANEWKNSDVIFVLDQNKLRQDFKLKSFDYHHYVNRPKIDPKHPSYTPDHTKREIAQDEYLKHRRSEAEEYTVKNINPLDKYLIEILVFKKGIDRIKELIINLKTSVRVDGSYKFIKDYKNANDPNIGKSEFWGEWLNRDILLKHPKTKIV